MNIEFGTFHVYKYDKLFKENSMLIVNNSKYNNKIVSIKLITGEEIMALVVNDESSLINVKNPLLLVMMTDESTQGMVAFAPWILGAEDSAVIEINKNSVIAITEARSDALDQYRIAVGDDTTSQSQPKAKQSIPPTSPAASRGRGR